MNHFLWSPRSARSLWPFFLLATAFMLLAVPAFMLGGVTWDELFDFEGVNGAFWHGINTIKGLNPDLSTITFDLEYFGNATRWPTYFFWRLLATTPWESFSGLSRTATILSGSYVGLNHLNAAIFGFLGIALVSLIGGQLGGRRLALLSAIFMALLPTWLGHSWMNSKDIPFATSYLTYTYGSVLLLARHSQRSCSSLLGSSFLLRALGVGLLLGSRIGSLPFVVIAECVYLVLLRSAYLRASLSVAFGLILGYLLTPQAWNDPIGYPIEAIRFIGDRQGSDSPLHTLSYLTFHLFESLPFLIVFGIGAFLLSWLWQSPLRKTVYEWIPVLLQLSIAPVLLVLGSKSIYNELRHVLFIYPPICLVASSGWLWCSERLRSRNLSRGLFSLFGLVLVLILALENVSLAPYQYIYRSDLARLLTPGLSVHRDYWGFSARESTSRCLKDSQCSSLMSQVPYDLRSGDWNLDLFNGLRDLLQSRSDIAVQSSPTSLQLQISPSRDSCKSLVETTRTVLFPTPKSQLVSRVANCS